MRKNSERVLRLTQLAMLVAVELILSLTPLGNLPTPWGIPLSFNVVPVAVGAVVMGPAEGAVLGLIFGVVSFWKGLTGTNVVSNLCIQASFLGALLILIVNRVLIGLIPGFVYKAFKKANATLRMVGVAVSCVLVPLLNTALYIVGNSIIFKDIFVGRYGEQAAAVATSFDLMKLMTVLLAPNAIPEALTCLIVGTAVCKALEHVIGEKK